MYNLKAIITRMLNGTWSFHDRKELAEHEKVTGYLFNIWLNAPDQTISDRIDQQKILAGIESSCFGESSSAITKIKQRWLTIGLSFAAACVLIGFIALPFSLYLPPSYITTCVSANETLTLILPDSSTVWLNAGTQLRYRKDFLKDRRVFLDGEGFFDVKKMDGAPFLVDFRDAFIEVKGTTFNIKTAGESAEVTLLSGRVDFGIKGSDSLFLMNPSDRITYYVAEKHIEKTSVKSALYDWRTGEYRFSDKTLDEILTIIHDVFDVDIRNQTSGKESELFTGIIRTHEPVMELIEKLCFSMDIDVKQVDDTIILY